MDESIESNLRKVQDETESQTNGSNKARGRRPRDNYIEKAQKELKEMQENYEAIKDKITAKERACHRNRMYALKARIRNRGELDDLKDEHSHLKSKVDELIDLLRSEVDDET